MKLNKTQAAVLLILSMSFLAWMPKDKGVQINIKKKIQSTWYSPRAGITLNYTKLILTKDQFNKLTSKEKHKDIEESDKRKEDGNKKTNAIIFQFNYTSEVYPYPTLKAYPMRAKGQEVNFGIPLNLAYSDSKPSPDLSVCNEQVTGDLRILVSDMQILKEESNPGHPEEYEYFLFTPKYDDSNQHVYFDISVFPSTSPDLTPKSKALKPSPPYN